MTASVPIIGNHPALLAVLEKATRLASIPRPVLVRGERGTGKELVARHIHCAGTRAKGPFVTINCGAFGGDLLRSELFGHERGAFTGASERRIGKLEEADGGTLFLDEIGNMSMEFQEKVLRVVEYQQFERTGGSASIQVDVRIVAATNADLEGMVAANEFRADLYDRLRFAELNLPPLRERRSDIPAIITHIARALATEMPGMDWRPFSADALGDLMRYYWPGNIRQLKNVIEHVYIMGDGTEDEIQPNELPREITAVEPIGDTFDDLVTAFERSLILDALKNCRDNQKAAAESLALTYDRFRHYYRKLDIKSYR